MKIWLISAVSLAVIGALFVLSTRLFATDKATPIEVVRTVTMTTESPNNSKESLDPAGYFIESITSQKSNPKNPYQCLMAGDFPLNSTELASLREHKILGYLAATSYAEPKDTTAPIHTARNPYANLRNEFGTLGGPELDERQSDKLFAISEYIEWAR